VAYKLQFLYGDRRNSLVLALLSGKSHLLSMCIWWGVLCLYYWAIFCWNW